MATRTSLWIRKLSGSQYVVADDKLTTGNIYWISSVIGTNSSGLGVTPDAPLATLAYALANLGTANNYDRFYLMPGHAESITAAGGITASSAGVHVIGLGRGSNRATLSFANTAATFAITAANVTLENIRVTSTVDEMVKMFNVSAPYCTLDGVDHFETTAMQTLQFILTTAAADHLTIKNCFHSQLTAGAGTQKWIELVGVDYARILDNVFYLTLKDEVASHTISGSTAVVMCQIGRNIFWQGSGGNTQTTIVNLVTTSTGFIHDNRARAVSTAVTTAAAFTGDACAFANNLWLDDAAASGLLAPAVGTD